MGKVLFIACTNVGQAMIEAMCTNDSIKSEIVGIVNLNAKKALNKANYRTYTDVSEKYNIPLHFCENVNDEETVQWIKDKAPDVIVQTGWSQKFRNELLNLPKYGCIGEHPAPLPRGRGAACVNWAILTGEKTWGDSFFHMVEQYDAGDVYAQEFFNIEVYDDVKTVYDRVAKASSKIIVENIDNWTEGKFVSITLDESIATYYKKRCPADGVFNFEMSADKLHDFIRAQTEPYPGAFFMYGDKKIITLQSRLVDLKVNDKPIGYIYGKTSNGGILVVCDNETVIELLRLKNEDGTYMWFAEDERFIVGRVL